MHRAPHDEPSRQLRIRRAATEALRLRLLSSVPTALKGAGARFQLEARSEHLALEITGWLSASSLRDFVRMMPAVRQHLAARCRGFLVDVSQLGHVDAAGLGMLLLLEEEARRASVTFAAVGISGHLGALLDCLMLDAHLHRAPRR